MKKLLLTTALLSALSAPALAQTTDVSPYLPGIDSGVRASNFIGKRVYVTEADTTGLADTAIAAADETWLNAGEISDIMISLTGDTEAVLVDFGGFLGIGEKTVAVALDQLTLVPDASSPQDYYIVFNGTRETLTNAPAFDPEMVFAVEAPADESVVTDPVATEMTDDTTATDPAATDEMADTGMADATDSTELAPADGEMVDLAAWAETDLVGKRVLGPNDEDVGEISAVALAADGAIEGAVVDVGGLLGIGEKKVALESDMLQLVTEPDGEIWFRVTATEEELEAMPPHAG